MNLIPALTNISVGMTVLSEEYCAAFTMLKFCVSFMRCKFTRNEQQHDVVCELHLEVCRL
jgi:hypothetical protein